MKYPNTSEVWDPEACIDYSDLIKNILNLLEDESGDKPSIKILVPGAGKGRVVRDLLECLLNEKVKYSVELVIIEPNGDLLKRFTQWLIRKGFQRKDEHKYVKGKIQVFIFQKTLEEYLKEKYSDGEYSGKEFDIVLCLLFLHYVPYGWLSILRTMYDLLKPDGSFIVDRICGQDPASQELLDFIDCDAHQLEKLDCSNDDCLKWRTFYLNRIFEKGAYWGSTIKGTNIKLVIEALEPLFAEHHVVFGGARNYQLLSDHLPWWWASEQTSNHTSVNLPSPPCLPSLPLQFEFHVFHGKHCFSNPAALESHWNLVKKACILTAAQNLGAILWLLHREKPFSFQDSERFVQDILPSIVLQLVASSGIIDYRHDISSIFIASGTLPSELGLPKLQKLFLLVSDVGDKGKDRIQAWLGNYIIYAHILKAPLSEEFISSGKRVLLYRQCKCDQSQTNMPAGVVARPAQEAGPPPGPVLGAGPCSGAGRSDPGFKKIPIPCACKVNLPEISLPKVKQLLTVKQLLWWELLQIDLQRNVNVDQGILNSLQEFVKSVSDTQADNDRRLRPLSLLMRHLGDILFIPIPTFFEYHGNAGSFQVRSIMGMGVTVSKPLSDEILIGIEDIYTLVSLLFRRFQDNYLSLKWVDNSRRASLRSAIAAIMARNWAHIFSSQVLVRFRGADKESLIPNELLDYIITRSEYIADVTGEIPLLWGEGFLECEEINGGEISGIEEINGGEISGILEEFRETSILEKLKEAAGGKFSNIIIRSKGLCERIGLPFGAAVGRHAIFAILENYIRNVSKYGVLPSNTNSLVICLQPQPHEADDDVFITVKLSSNSQIGEKGEWQAKASEIERHISEPVIDQTGALPPSGWGFREMKIHACLLAGEDISALLAEGQTHFFRFDKKAAQSSGEYTFYFKVRKYQPVLKFDSQNKLDEFLKNPMKSPLCDFVVLQGDLAHNYNDRTWAAFPSRVAIVGAAKDKSWLTNRVIFLDSVPSNEDALISQLWEKFWGLLRSHGACEYNIVVVDNGQPIHLGQSRQKLYIAIHHGDEASSRVAKQTGGSLIPFSHQKLMMMWINEVHQKKEKQDNLPAYVVNDPVIIFKWKTLLGAKVLLIDTRLYEQYSRLSDDVKQELKTLGVYVIPESEKIDSDLRVNSCNMCLNQFQFISVHYGYLQENPDTPLLQKDKLESFPPFVFMHTARGKIEAGFVEEHYWFRKIVSVGSLISAFNEKFGLEIKMRLMAVFLSPQQGGRAL